MVDPAAPVIPGESAAGIRLGSPVVEALNALGDLATREPIAIPYSSCVFAHYRSEMVDLGEEDGIVKQISVHGAYRGMLMGRIGLGSTIAEIEQSIGPCEEDEEDNLAIRGVPGFCFDAEGDFYFLPSGVDFSHPAVRAARVTAMYVFPRAASDA